MLWSFFSFSLGFFLFSFGCQSRSYYGDWTDVDCNISLREVRSSRRDGKFQGNLYAHSGCISLEFHIIMAKSSPLFMQRSFLFRCLLIVASSCVHFLHVSIDTATKVNIEFKRIYFMSREMHTIFHRIKSVNYVRTQWFFCFRAQQVLNFHFITLEIPSLSRQAMRLGKGEARSNRWRNSRKKNCECARFSPRMKNMQTRKKNLTSDKRFLDEWEFLGGNFSSKLVDKKSNMWKR